MAKPIKITVRGTETDGDASPTVQDLLDQVDILEEVKASIARESSSELV